MGRCRFVEPGLERLTLSDGDWVDIKRELTAGEERDAVGRMTRSWEQGGRPQIDPTQVQTTTLVAYLHAWSFVDKAGAPVAVSEGAIRQLDEETFTEIHTAIHAHVKALHEKKAATRNGGSGS